jgi:hypothetical protein
MRTNRKYGFTKDLYNLTVEIRKTEKENHDPLTHAYAQLAADVHLGWLCSRIHFVVSRQRMLPQTARAHSLGRYVQV